MSSVLIISSRQTSNKYLNFGFYTYLYSHLNSWDGRRGVCCKAKCTHQQLHDHESLVAIAVLQPSSSTNVLQGKVCVISDIVFKHGRNSFILFCPFFRETTVLERTHNSTIFYYQAKIQYANQDCPETIQLESFVYE